MKQWIKYTLGILLTLVILAAVAGTGYMFGARQSGATFVHPMMNPGQAFGNGFDPHHQGMSVGRDMHNFGRGYDRSGFGGFLSPVFGLIKLAVLAAMGWIGYKFIKNSGWKLTRETAPVAARVDSAQEAPAETPVSPSEENRE